MALNADSEPAATTTAATGATDDATSNAVTGEDASSEESTTNANGSSDSAEESASSTSTETVSKYPLYEKEVATEAHIDSPHAYWVDDNFELRAHFKSGDREDQPLIDDTVIYVGKGWNDRGESNYTYTVPDESWASFLGTSGQQLYRSPALPGWSNTPAWVGMGADAEVPVDSFRDQQFALDILDFDGPGRMEMFNKIGNSELTRLLSSHDTRYRSYWLTAGTHTHNETTFTKPGRYDITYRVTTRQNGKLVISDPQVMTWQVGGVNPEGTLADPQKAFAAASSTPGTGAGNPTVSLKPYQADGTTARDGDNFLTTISFDTGNATDQGIVVFTIDGYYLTELTVKDGKASWDEALGTLASDIQAYYIPESGPTPKWISAQTSYTSGSTLSITDSANSIAEAKTKDPAPAFPSYTGALSDTAVKVTTTPVEDGRLAITVHSDDPNMRAYVTGGVYDPGEDENDAPWCGTTFNMSQGDATYLVNYSDCFDSSGNSRIILKFAPHPLLDNGSSIYRLANVPSERTTTGTSVLLEADDGTYNGETSAVSETETPTTTTDTTTEESINEASADAECTRENPCWFSTGHVDVIGTEVEDGKLVLTAKEDVTGSEVEREPETIILHVRKQAYEPATKDIEQIGVASYTLPQTQNMNLLWPGWDTLEMQGSGYSKVSVTFDKITAPEGGKIYMYQSSGLSGTLVPLLENDQWSFSDGSVLNIDSPSHNHVYWSFTKPGTYTMTAHATAYADDGSSTLTSDTVTYTWKVDASERDADAQANSSDNADADSTAGKDDTSSADTADSTTDSQTPKPISGVVDQNANVNTDTSTDQDTDTVSNQDQNADTNQGSSDTSQGDTANQQQNTTQNTNQNSTTNTKQTGTKLAKTGVSPLVLVPAFALLLAGGICLTLARRKLALN